MKLRISFLGAARNVTGSRYLLQVRDKRLLIDCGLHQERQFRDRDFQPFPVRPDSIDAVLLTHAHLDHCGYLPKLVRDGFRGPIHCTPATAEIAKVVLMDSAHLQEEDMRFKRKRHRRSKRRSPRGYEPLYRVADAERAVRRFRTVRLEEPVTLGPGISATYHGAGHILGSAFIKLVVEEGKERRTFLFSGDVGRRNKPIIRDPVQFREADYVLCESTYGDREHSDHDIATELEEVVLDTVERRGNLLIPSFSIERAQEVLYHLNDLMRAKRIPRLMTFLDSPMAVTVTKIFERHEELYDETMSELVDGGMGPFDFPELAFCRTRDQSKAINAIRGSCIIIAGSGMCTGGRIKHHLVHHIHRRHSTVLFVGYQANGTLGRKIVDGAEIARILGHEHRVRARIARIGGFSAHADRNELIQWLSSLESPPRRVFVTHGEDGASEAFASLLGETTGWHVTVPDYRNEYALE